MYNQRVPSYYNQNAQHFPKHTQNTIHRAAAKGCGGILFGICEQQQKLYKGERSKSFSLLLLSLSLPIINNKITPAFEVAWQNK